MDVDLVKTDKGKIDLEDLKNRIEDDEIKILSYQDYGGYFVKNDVEKIYEICKGKVIVIHGFKLFIGCRSLFR